MSNQKIKLLKICLWISRVALLVSIILTVSWNIAYKDNVSRLEEYYTNTGYINENLELITYKDKSIAKLPCEKYIGMHLYTKKMMDRYHNAEKNVKQGVAVDGKTFGEFNIYTVATKTLLDGEDIDVKDTAFFTNPLTRAREVVSKHISYGRPDFMSVTALIVIMFISAVGMIASMLVLGRERAGEIHKMEGLL